MNLDILLQKFSDLYFNQIDFKFLQNIESFRKFGEFYLFFILAISIFHTFVIYTIFNITNSYRHLKSILMSIFYAFLLSFSFGKIFETLFSQFLNSFPYAGNELSIFNKYGSLILVFILELLLLKGRLKMLYDEGKLGTEPIETELYFGVIVANLLTVLIFIIV